MLNTEQDGKYSSVSVSLSLCGNMLHGRVSAWRYAATTGARYPNEWICSVEFETGDKIVNMQPVWFVGSGGTNFKIDNINIYTDAERVGTGTFDITLTATGGGYDNFEGYFNIPCELNLDGFSEV